MRRSELERLSTVSVRGRLYVAIDEVLDLVKAKEEEAKQSDAETQPARKAAEKPERAG